MNNGLLKNILLVEDDPGDVVLFEEMLVQQGCTARIAKAIRLSEAIEVLRDTMEQQVILLDLNLPDSSGLATLTGILAVAPRTPVIILTGLSDEGIGVDAVKAGAQDYLVKGDIDGRILKRSMHYALERKKLELKLSQMLELFEKQARIDFLTGIYNRLMFHELMAAERQRAIRHKTDLSLIMFDLDHFKEINDIHGHVKGDQVLKEVAGLIAENVRNQDLLCRWGGEEFMLLAPKINLKQAMTLADKLRLLIEQHDFGDGLRVTASFGVTRFLSQDSDDKVTDRVDKALYLAKQNGRNRCEQLI